jgi:hypothetical protein
VTPPPGLPTERGAVAHLVPGSGGPSGACSVRPSSGCPNCGCEGSSNGATCRRMHACAGSAAVPQDCSHWSRWQAVEVRRVVSPRPSRAPLAARSPLRSGRQPPVPERQRPVQGQLPPVPPRRHPVRRRLAAQAPFRRQRVDRQRQRRLGRASPVNRPMHCAASSSPRKCSSRASPRHCPPRRSSR